MSVFLNLAGIPTRAEVDLLVVGAGSAGCCAAIAARMGGVQRVLLAERYGTLGGTSTGILDTFYGFFTPGPEPRKVIGGVPDQVVDRLDATGSVMLRANTYGAGTGVTYDPERLKRVWDVLMEHHGVQVLHHALLVEAEANSAGRLVAAIFASKSGFFRVRARRFIDASGDADLCHLAGIPYEKAGELEPAQTLTTTFRMANVDLERFRKTGGNKMMEARMAEAVESGRHALPRKKGSAHAMVIQGMIATVAVRVADVDATDIEQLSLAEREGRRQAYVYEDFLRDCVPGYEHARIAALSTQIGVRETRRVYGEYRLTREDCLNVARFSDRVLLCGAPIEDHRKGTGGEEETAWAYVPDAQAYDVPYRCLIPKERDELWVVGRCFSATHDAHASCRSMGQTMAMGQAAGIAAAQATSADYGARDVDIPALQVSLRQTGSLLEMPEHVAQTAADAWRANRSLA
jgi:hypothetical protein